MVLDWKLEWELVDSYQAYIHSHVRIEVRVYINIVDFECFMIQKVAIEMLISLIAEVITIKIVMTKSFIFQIDQIGTYVEMFLTKQVVFVIYLVFCLIILPINKQ